MQLSIIAKLFAPSGKTIVGGPNLPIFTKTFEPEVTKQVLNNLMCGRPFVLEGIKFYSKSYDDEKVEVTVEGNMHTMERLDPDYIEMLKSKGWEFDEKAAYQHRLLIPVGEAG